MFGVPATIRVFVAVSPADLRKGVRRACPACTGRRQAGPPLGHLFVFANRKHDRIKILYWDRDGYAIRMKRLEKGTYRWPAQTSDHVEWTAAELAAVLGGIDLKATRRRPRFALAAS